MTGSGKKRTEHPERSVKEGLSQELTFKLHSEG